MYLRYASPKASISMSSSLVLPMGTGLGSVSLTQMDDSSTHVIGNYMA